MSMFSSRDIDTCLEMPKYGRTDEKGPHAFIYEK